MKFYKNKILANYRPYLLRERLWHFLIERAGLSKQSTWGQLGKKAMNKLTNVLTNDVYDVKGKTTFKEEFVTCGGVSLESIDFRTMQSTVFPNLYFLPERLWILTGLLEDTTFKPLGQPLFLPQSWDSSHNYSENNFIPIKKVRGKDGP